MMKDCEKRQRKCHVTLRCILDSSAKLSDTMNKIGTFKLTTGKPRRVQGFGHEAAISWRQDNGRQKQIMDEREAWIDVFSDETYPHENSAKYVDAGFLQGRQEAEFVNQAAAISAWLKSLATLSV